MGDHLLLKKQGGQEKTKSGIILTSTTDVYGYADVIDVEDVEIIEELAPIRTNNDKPRVRIRKEKEKVEQILTKKRYKQEVTPEQRAKNRKKSLASYRRLKRAKKVGLEPLGRKTGEAKREWYAELEKKEKEMGII